MKERLASNLFFSPCFSPFDAQYKRLNRSSSLFLLFVKDEICSHPSLKKSDESNSLFEKSDLLFCSQKTSDSNKIPKSEFPILSRMGGNRRNMEATIGHLIEICSLDVKGRKIFQLMHWTAHGVHTALHCTTVY